MVGRHPRCRLQLSHWTASTGWLTNAARYKENNGTGENLLHRFRYSDDSRRRCRLRQSGKFAFDHCRFNHWRLAAGGRISFTRTSRGGPGDGVYYFFATGWAVHSQISADRKSDARRHDVDLERDRDHRGACRLDKKVIACEEFVSGRGGGWCWFWSAQYSRQLFTAGFHWSACNTFR